MDAAQRETWDKTLVEVQHEIRSHTSDYVEAGRWLDTEYTEQRCRELRSASDKHVLGVRKSAHLIVGSPPGEDARCWRLSCVVTDLHAAPPDLRVSAVHGEPLLWARRVLLVAALVSDPKAHTYAGSLTDLATLPWLTDPPFRCRAASAPTNPSEDWSKPWMGLVRMALQRVRATEGERNLPSIGQFEKDGWIWKEATIGEAIERAISLLTKGERLRRRAEAELLAGRDRVATEVGRELAVVKAKFDRLAEPFVQVAYYLELDGQPLDLLIRNGDPMQTDGAVRVLRQIQAEHLRRVTQAPTPSEAGTSPSGVATAGTVEHLDSAEPPQFEFTTTDLRATSDPLWQQLQRFAKWMAQGTEYSAHFVWDAVLDLFIAFNNAGLKRDAGGRTPVGEVWRLQDGREFYSSIAIPESERERATKQYYFEGPGYDGWYEAIPSDRWPAPKVRPTLAKWAKDWARERERQLAGMLADGSGLAKSPRVRKPVKRASRVDGYLTFSQACARLLDAAREAYLPMTKVQAKGCISNAKRSKKFKHKGARRALRIEGVSFLDWVKTEVGSRMNAADHAL